MDILTDVKTEESPDGAVIVTATYRAADGKEREERTVCETPQDLVDCQVKLLAQKAIFEPIMASIFPGEAPDQARSRFHSGGVASSRKGYIVGEA